MKLKQITTLFMIVAAMIAIHARDTYNFNANWRINKQKKTVTLPHAWNEDESFRVGIKEMSDTVMWYRKDFVLSVPAWLSDKSIELGVKMF